jgi:hypothetical protein
MRLLTKSAAGWLLMAALDDKKADYTIRRANIAIDRSEDRVKVEEIMAMLPRIREQGYSYSEDVPFVGVATLCVLLPILVQGQQVVMSVGGLTDRIRPRKNELMRLLKRSAASLVGEGDAPGPIPLCAEVGIEPTIEGARAAPDRAIVSQDMGVHNWFEALGQYGNRPDHRASGH